MTQSKNTKEEALKKWAPILDATTSKVDADRIYQEGDNFGSLLPMSMKIASRLVANDLVSVQPLGGPSPDKLDEIKKEVKSTNRDRKIDSVIEGKDYEEMKVEDHPDFKKGLPKGSLFYLDYQYGGSTESNSFRPGTII